MTASRLFVMGTILAACSLATGQPLLVFYDSFEEPIGINWSGWDDVTVPPDDHGPEPLLNSVSHPHEGSLCARQEQAQPAWYASVHDETGLANDLDKTIRLSVWQFEDFENANEPIDDPLNLQYHNHDQVQGWLALMNEEETEFFAVGVHGHWASPEPLLDWWHNISWATTTDGWHTTPVPRLQGWVYLEIVLHPYTGEVGDVEFNIRSYNLADELVYEYSVGGRRQSGDNCRGVAVTRIGLGASPAHVEEDYISNTYEFFYYDEVELTTEEIADLPCPNPELRFDADADGDVDQADFAAFQACYTETGSTYDCPACRCMNSDDDVDVDEDDYGPFEACASGPDVPADVTCDDALPPP